MNGYFLRHNDWNLTVEPYTAPPCGTFWVSIVGPCVTDACIEGYLINTTLAKAREWGRRKLVELAGGVL